MTPRFRIIRIPANITVDVPGGKSELSFDGFLRSRTGDPKVFGASLAAVLVAGEIRTRFLDRQPGDEVRITEDEWRMLDAATREPGVPYIPDTLLQLGPFVEAITRAEPAPGDRPKPKRN
jgi:hypothetical protein